MFAEHCLFAVIFFAPRQLPFQLFTVLCYLCHQCTPGLHDCVNHIIITEIFKELMLTRLYSNKDIATLSLTKNGYFATLGYEILVTGQPIDRQQVCKVIQNCCISALSQLSAVDIMHKPVFTGIDVFWKAFYVNHLSMT